MNLIPQTSPAGTIIYPESDGQPMAENTRQLRWIVVLFSNLAALFRDNLDVFVAGNQFWYPVEGDPQTRVAPDVYVVFGRPKGDRSSYRQWEEGNIPMTVVFEVLSPSNDWMEMDDKYAFYEQYGVEEYYVYDPDSRRLKVFVRRGEVFRRIRPADGFVSPRLGIRFDLSGEDLVVYGPRNHRFLTLEEMQEERDRERRRADQAEQRIARLIELGRKVRLGQASAEELHDLKRLEREPFPPT
jgi:Uma2 family endonuclease